MSYDFSFSRKTITFALAGFVFVSSMLFIAGLLVGTNWKAEPKATAEVAAKPPVAAPMPEPTTAPPEPAMRADVVISRPAVPSEAGALSEDPALVRQSHSQRPLVSSRRTQPSLPAPQNDGELKIIQEAEPSVNEAAETPAFSVQVGVFATKGDANQLVRFLQSRGYVPIVVAVNDDEDRLWYAVRLGAYAKKAEAIEAASTFTRQEKIQTIVRPLGSL